MTANKNDFPSEEYLPKARTGYMPEAHSLESTSPEGVTSMLPNVVEDDIVVNNISWQEFDYIENPYVDSELDTDY